MPQLFLIVGRIDLLHAIQHRALKDTMTFLVAFVEESLLLVEVYLLISRESSIK
jgi:hypothetical protein